MYVKLTGGWLLEMKLGQLDKVHELGQVDCIMIVGKELLQVKLTRY